MKYYAYYNLLFSAFQCLNKERNRMSLSKLVNPVSEDVCDCDNGVTKQKVFEDYNKRLQSFYYHKFPIGLFQSPEDLAKAGFYYW